MAEKTVIVTGASRGLGAATVKILVETGVNVVLNARSEEDLQEVVAATDPEGRRTLIVPGDVSNAEACLRLVQETVAHFDGLDGLVNNAGVLHPIAAIADADPAAWDNNIAVNLLGPFYLTHYALPHLRARQGRVINVSSGAAVSANAGWSAYCAAKAAINHFTRVLAEEEQAIVPLSFRPGVVDTEMQREIREEGAAGMPAAAHRRFLQYHEEGDLLPPERPGRALAALALFAPREWRGEFINWSEDRVQELTTRL
ncbi:MAG TPA: SDR family NAD(P)-dependent oxidoreductase [Candidatus Sulfomarinibacteraceae bacterium]|nr:SDR family NAD(P)-dependent oxidoreductase [Candidatus Sulfomarinibacteraceae bacterium]